MINKEVRIISNYKKRKKPYINKAENRYKSNTGCRVNALYPHFRYFMKSKHPALIVGEQNSSEGEEYRYRKVMHGKKDGRHNNEKVYPNPNPHDSEPMYINRRVRHELKGYFGDVPYPWKYKKR